jgi:hypothetical protein
MQHFRWGMSRVFGAIVSVILTGIFAAAFVIISGMSLEEFFTELMSSLNLEIPVVLAEIFVASTICTLCAILVWAFAPSWAGGEWQYFGAYQKPKQIRHRGIRKKTRPVTSSEAVEEGRFWTDEFVLSAKQLDALTSAVALRPR